MSNKRIIATINTIDNWVVQSIKFNKYLPIGRLNTSIEFLNRWNADEILITDISGATLRSGGIKDIYQNILKENFLPIGYSGGIKKFETVVKLFNAGFDKICFNSCVFENRKLVEQTIDCFGRQSVILRCDYIEKDGGRFVYKHWAHEQSESITEWFKLIKDINPSEVLLQSVTRDGMKNGLDLGVANFTDCLNQIIILLGGVGTKEHITEAFNCENCHAVAVGNILHHKELAYPNLNTRHKND